MKQKMLLKFVSWTMTHTAWMTMAFSPLALGKQAESITAQNLKASIQEIQLNKKMTMKEFWEKTKADYPGYAYWEMEQLVLENPNALVPQFQVKSVKDSGGNEVPVLTFTENGKTHTIQVFGDEKKYITFDGVAMTEAEASQPQKMMQKLMDHDSKLQNQYDQAIMNGNVRSEMQQKPSTGRFASYTQLPKMTPQMWKAMTAFERAQYFVQMRMMWQAAKKVNFYSEDRTPASQPKAAPKKKTSSLYKLFLGNDAEAQTDKPFCGVLAGRGDLPACFGTQAELEAAQIRAAEMTKRKKPPTTKPATPVVTAPKATTPPKAPKVDGKPNIISENANQAFNADECINAGWITVNSSRDRKCSYDSILENKNKRYENMDFVRETIQHCKAKGQYACSPLVYGYPNGEVLCISGGGSATAAAKNNYQKATHWDGPCDERSRLTSGAFVNDKNHILNEKNLIKNGKYSNSPAERQAQIDAIEKDPENYKQTQSFLDGLLKKEKKANSFQDLIQKGEWNPEIDNLMVAARLNFEKEINKAIENCEVNFSKKQFDTNQKGACDQLHRRWLSLEQFISKYRQKACPDETIYLFASDKTSNRTGAEDLNKNTENLPCGCYEKSTSKPTLLNKGESKARTDKPIKRFPLGTSPEANKAAREICEGAPVIPPVVVDACAQLTFTHENLNGQVELQGEQCVCKAGTALAGSQPRESSMIDRTVDDDAGNSSYKRVTTLSCDKEAEIETKKCDKYGPLKLDENCNCIDKKGKSKGPPKKVKTGFIGFFYSTGKKSDKDAQGDRYTCDQGPNWWKIGGIAAGIGVLTWLLWPKKKKKCPSGTYGSPPNCKPNTCPAGTSGTYPNCVRCEEPFQFDGSGCICNVRCVPGSTLNPANCTCSEPSEGGEGTNPCEMPNPPASCGPGGGYNN